MASTILVKRSATPAKVPTTVNLSLGELGINTHDGSLYFKKDVTGVESIVTVSIVGNAEVFTNKTFDTAATGNVFKINSTAISAVSGTGSTVVLSSGPSISNLTLTGTLTAGGSAGTSGQVLQSTGTGVQWVSGGAGSAIPISDDTTTNATFYPSFVNASSGSLTTNYVSSSKLTYNPSTGTLGVTALSSTSLTAPTISTLSLDTGTTGSINLGTGANAKAISLGNSSVASTIALNNNTTLAAGKTVTLSGSTSGTIELQAAAIAGTNTITFPASTGTVALTSGTGDGTLTMGVSGVGLSGSATFTANQSGASTFTVTSDATSANTFFTIVSRDASGDFSAGTITAALSGNATTATSATSATTAGSVTNAATFNGSGTGAASGTTFDGSVARTISYNTLGASPLAGSTSLTTTGTVTTGTWSGLFGAVSGANLTNLTAGNLSGTIPTAVLGNSTLYVGTTAILLNRASASQALTGITSIDGSAASVANALTFSNGGAGDASGTTFNGSAARTISYNSVGASPLAGSSSLVTTGLVTSGTWKSGLDAETYSTSASVSAGTNNQGQGALTSDYNVITTTAANPSGVTLPVPTVGRRIIVVNKGTNPINVYPATGTAIDALGANVAISLAVAGWIEFNASSVTQWYSTAGISTSGNAATATALATARTLWGQSFNGTANVTGSMTSVGDITGTGAVTLTATAGALGLVATGANSITASTNGLTRVTIDSNGNVGIGVTPSAWGTGYKALQIGGQGESISASTTTSQVNLGSNGFYNGTSWVYNNSSSAGLYQIDNATHKWYSAGAGSLGSTLNWTQAMTLDASGNLGVGTGGSTIDSKLAVVGQTNLDGSYFKSFFVTLGNADAVAGKRILVTLPTGATANNYSGTIKIGGPRAANDTSSSQVTLAAFRYIRSGGSTGSESRFYVYQTDGLTSSTATYQWYFDTATGTPYLRFGQTGNTYAYTISVESTFSTATFSAAVDAGTVPSGTVVNLASQQQSILDGGYFIGTNGSVRLRLASDGALNFVGAGTAGSTQAVSFSGSAPVDTLTVNSLGYCVLGGLRIKGTDTANSIYQVAQIGISSDNLITFGTGASQTERLRIDATGNSTFTGQVISTRANSTTTGGGQIYLNGATGNRIDFNTNGVAAPAFTTRSAGTKIVLYPGITASAADHALGIEGSTLWFSVPTTSEQFKWYAGTTVVGTLSGTGLFTATTFSGSGASLTSLTAGNLSGTIPSGVLGNSTLYVGTTAVALNRASANQSLQGILSVAMPGSTSGAIVLQPAAVAGLNTITLPASTGTVALTNNTLYVGTTAISLGRASATQALTGITSIDGSSASCTGNAATASNVAYSGLTGTVPTWNQNTTGSSASCTGNAATATTLQTARTINGTGFDGSASINTTEWFHSDRDFPNGTLITTNINYAVSSGDPFVLEIRGNSYGNIIPLDLLYQGYIYADTIINHGGLSNGFSISGLVAINVGGNLCFWFPTQGYWNGYNVKVYAAYATRATNRVTSITGTTKPTSTKEVALSASIRQSLHSGNYNSYAPTLTGTGASGSWGISVTGSSGSAATATNQSGGTVSATTGSFSSTLTVGGAIVRSAAGVGYLSGNYSSSESPSTSGAIYTIGGSYVPTSTTLGNMYGIGYGYAGNGGIGNPGGVGSSIWGMYVASAGTASVFLDSDNGRGHFASYVVASNITSGGNVTGSSASCSGNAATATSATSAGKVSSPDGDRNASTKLPTTTGNAVRFDFSSASSAGTGGNYAGVMTYAPWDGTTASTGDASYQLAFGSTATNGGGIPQLNIRKGIDSTWNSWYTILHSGNYSTYASPLAGSASLVTTGTVTSGTWSGSFGAVSGASLTSLNASNLSSGTVPTARLGTGTADATTYLRGDQTWASIAAGTSISAGNTSATVTDTGTNGAFTVVTEGSTRLIVANDGTLLVGGLTGGLGVYSVQAGGLTGAANWPQFSNISNGYLGPIFWKSFNGTLACELSFVKTRGSTHGSKGTVLVNDPIGFINFIGSDSTNTYPCVSIQAIADASIVSSSSAGRLVFGTTTAGTTTISEKLRITNGGTIAYNQPTPAARGSSVTLLVDELKYGIIVFTNVSGGTLTLPTGTLTEGGFAGIYTNMAFEWSVINTGAAASLTVAASTGHTIVGNGLLTQNTSARFVSRRTAANTFISYRLS